MSEFNILFSYDTYAPLTLHISVVTFFVLTGAIFNTIIIYLYMNKQNLKETDVYILAMAFVDIFACMVVCPQYPFMEIYINEYKKHNHFALKQLLTCTGIS